MKKLLLVILPLIVLLLSGCEDIKYPYIQYQHSYYDFDADNRQILVEDGYILNQAHSYDVVETDTGYSITLYFVKGDAE